MKKKYLIALDMDGTLLTTDRTICPDTARYLKSLQDEGHKIVITSGRPLRAILPYYKDMGLNGPIICYNGTYIYDDKDAGVAERHTLPSTVIKDFIAQIGEHNFRNILCEDDSDIYMLTEDKSLFGFFWKEGMDVHFGSMKDNLNINPYIFIIDMKDHELDDKIVKLGFSYPGLGVRFWSNNSTTAELYFLDINKAAALRKVAGKLGIPMDDIIAFGDAENDFEMMEESGIGVAMLNGQDSVKEKANLVSLDDNDHDGIKKTLEYLLATNK